MGVIAPTQNAAFVCAMERVLDVYQRPYEAACPVVCLDESPKQLIRESRPLLVLPDGSTRYDGEYHRHGVVPLYMLHEPLRGWRRVQPEARHDRLTFARVVARLLEEDYPTAERVPPVLDNLSAHQPAALYEVFPAARPRPATAGRVRLYAQARLLAPPGRNRVCRPAPPRLARPCTGSGHARTSLPGLANRT